MLKSLALVALLIGGTTAHARQLPATPRGSETLLAGRKSLRETNKPVRNVARRPQKAASKPAPAAPKRASQPVTTSKTTTPDKKKAAPAPVIAKKTGGTQQLMINFKANGECTLTAVGLGKFGCLGQPGVLYPKEFYISDDDKAGTHHSREFDVDLPYAILLWGQRGIYLHEGVASLKATGGQHSHGCIRVGKPNAAKVYKWLQGRTKVTITYPWESTATALPSKPPVVAQPAPSRKVAPTVATKSYAKAKPTAVTPTPPATVKARPKTRPATPKAAPRKDDSWGFF